MLRQYHARRRQGGDKLEELIPWTASPLIKLEKDDRLLAAITAVDDRDTLTVKTSMGGEQRLNTARYKVTGRGGKGHEFVSRGQIVEVMYEPVKAPPPPA